MHRYTVGNGLTNELFGVLYASPNVLEANNLVNGCPTMPQVTRTSLHAHQAPIARHFPGVRLTRQVFI